MSHEDWISEEPANERDTQILGISIAEAVTDKSLAAYVDVLKITQTAPEWI
ncbi:MAG: hypothetical protein Q8P59_05460 [Dehalococcoidia bacterium]|nr:hypothetical protein [Dehalococcoidia bacterium]